jgi:hypothetical protein
VVARNSKWSRAAASVKKSIAWRVIYLAFRRPERKHMERRFLRVCV